MRLRACFRLNQTAKLPVSSTSSTVQIMDFYIMLVYRTPWCRCTVINLARPVWRAEGQYVFCWCYFLLSSNPSFTGAFAPGGLHAGLCHAFV